MFEKYLGPAVEEWNTFKYNYYNWDKLTPGKKFQAFQKFGDRTGRMIGLQVLTSTKLSPIFFMLGIVIAVYVILAIYTIAYYTKNGSFADGVTCLSLFGLYVSVSFFF